MKNEDITHLVEDGTLVLVSANEIKKLRKKATEAENEISNYNYYRAKLKDIVFECNCEGDPCTYIEHADPKRNPKPPIYCPKDGNSCRWKKIVKK